MNIEKFIKGMINEYREYGDLHNLEYEDTQEIAYALEDLLKYKERYDKLIKKIKDKKEENYKLASDKISRKGNRHKAYVDNFVIVAEYNMIDDLLEDLLEG